MRFLTCLAGGQVFDVDLDTMTATTTKGAHAGQVRSWDLRRGGVGGCVTSSYQLGGPSPFPLTPAR